MPSKQDKVKYVKSQNQFRPHHCHWPECPRQVPPAMWGCKDHWYKLPIHLRDKIWKAYRPGQEKDLRPSREYLKVADEVQEWIRQYINKTPAVPGVFPKPPWLLLDVPNLAWRAHYTTGKLSFNGKPTGVIFGVLRDLQQLHTRFGKNYPVFCFDSGRPLREKIYPKYKANRENNEARKQVRRQIRQLRDEILPELGYRNVFHKKGYEADDIIASIVHMDEGRFRQCYKSIIVSGDQDLYQLLHANVLQYHPVQSILMTPRVFHERYGFSPEKWSLYKAITGCATDNIKGIKGVGPGYACQYLQGTLTKWSEPEHQIKNGSDIIESNLKLVKLPFPGCPEFDLREDDTSSIKWKKVCEQFGIRRLQHL